MDVPDVVRLAVDSELFSADDAPVVETMLAEYFGGKNATGHVCVIATEEHHGPVAVAYYEPATATDGTWYLTMIAVRLDRQRHGCGGKVLQHVEDDLRSNQQRILLVETSGLPEFARARGFYRKSGYDETARVRDYYAAGDDMVLFYKALAASAPAQ
ncbi:GNAT family N-acetyltransferase [Mycolicibacterium hodleri]|uniref:N-acetyltransferase n=1 Tax=Mycolicibacterium hodleri TaxID=49897 RepID=A0A502EDS0_9MYCO|nr:GNAT family N-acetyltransferase [Mycolicibacterium hodleri]TPG35843.1 N-acetyltransferase [Mycolicibacterium hodleri]